jgi:hypothetical protein
MITRAEIRDALEKCYPEVTDLEFNIKHSGFAHEHPLIAIAVVLISSIVLATTNPAKLKEFTRYSDRFIRDIAANMQISGLWRDDKYDCSDWHTGELIPPPENRVFWDRVLIGEGSLFRKETDSHTTTDSGFISWQDKLV